MSTDIIATKGIVKFDAITGIVTLEKDSEVKIGDKIHTGPKKIKTNGPYGSITAIGGKMINTF